jgi:hypothetical protein
LSEEVPLSPKFQAHEVGELVDVSVNVTVSGVLPVSGVPVKLATGIVTGGGALTVI